MHIDPTTSFLRLVVTLEMSDILSHCCKYDLTLFSTLIRLSNKKSYKVVMLETSLTNNFLEVKLLKDVRYAPNFANSIKWLQRDT